MATSSEGCMARLGSLGDARRFESCGFESWSEKIAYADD